MNRKEIYDLVDAERQRQADLFGEPPRTRLEWIGLMTEELGELAQEVNTRHYRGGNNLDFNLKIEAIQLAALVIAMLEQEP